MSARATRSRWPISRSAAIPRLQKNAKGKWVNGCQANEFVASKLTNAGTAEVSYHWLDTGAIGPGWFASSSGDAIAGGADNVTIPAGQGLWTAGSGYKLVIPAPEL